MENYRIEREGAAPGQFIGRVFKASGKRVFGFRFNTAESREKYITDFLGQQERRSAAAKEAAQKRSEMRKNMVNPFQVGEILYDSWGYEQTNIDFYQVVEIGPKSIKLRPIGQRMVEAAGDMSEYVEAVKDQFTGEAFSKTLQILSTGTIYVSSTHGWISKWDGKKKYQSHYA